MAQTNQATVRTFPIPTHKPDTSREKIKLHLYGAVGVGKTYLLGDCADVAAMSPMLLVDVEGGCSTIAHRTEGIEVIKLQTFNGGYREVQPDGTQIFVSGPIRPERKDRVWGIDDVLNILTNKDAHQFKTGDHAEFCVAVEPFQEGYFRRYYRHRMYRLHSSIKTRRKLCLYPRSVPH